MKIKKPDVGSLIEGGPFDGLKYRGYKVLHPDPPWKFKSRTALKVRNYNSARDVEKHYPTMTPEELKALPMRDLAHPDGCHLFMWVTSPMLKQGMDLMDAWGFKFSTLVFTWVKLKRSHDPMQLRVLRLVEEDLHVGLGLTSRKNCEFVLLGRRGNCRRIARDVREVIVSPVRQHSRKPPEVKERIERYCAGPYLELFSRESADGWEAWGNETGSLDRGG